MSTGQKQHATWSTPGGVTVWATYENVDGQSVLDDMIEAIDSRRGMVLTSGVETPGRYTRADIGFVDPPLSITASARTLTIEALNDRGLPLLHAFSDVLGATSFSSHVATWDIPLAEHHDSEEERTRQPSVLTALRAIIAAMSADQDSSLGLYGAFGYDLVLAFENVAHKLQRDPSKRDVVLFVPDQVLYIDRARNAARLSSYEFAYGEWKSNGFDRKNPLDPYTGAQQPKILRDHQPGEYAALVDVAKQYFARGDLFEVVPGQVFYEPLEETPGILFRTLARREPAPFGFFTNLGEQEYLVGASPEMYVRVEPQIAPDGSKRLRVETCPISGTIARGRDALEDAHQIRTLLGSTKDESELTMCTDVDRNDKARVCEPGSIHVIGRRQIELYARLIHTVDHVEGILRPDRDALDAFLTHAWAVTVTGAPKRAAIEFIEQHEKSPRRWYGGAVGFCGFDGRLNTGLTLRTVHIEQGVAAVRAGATLLHDSDNQAEEAETELKASNMLDAIRTAGRVETKRKPAKADTSPGTGRRILLVDHQDSFVHMLGDYFRQSGAEVVTYRAGFPVSLLTELKPDLVVLSPGPGRPKDFDLDRTIRVSLEHQLPIFGVCLGLQGLAEYFGGTLGQLSIPMHGKASEIRLEGDGGRVLSGMPETFQVGRYHSLFADTMTLPRELTVTATTDDGVIMALEHESLPIAAVQFHPESIMSAGQSLGLQIVRQAVSRLRWKD